MELIHAAQNIGPQFLKSNQKKEVGCLPGHALYLQFGSEVCYDVRGEEQIQQSQILSSVGPYLHMHTVVQILTMAVITLLFNNE